MGEFGRIWEDLGGFGRIWEDLERPGILGGPGGSLGNPWGGLLGVPQHPVQLAAHTLGFSSCYTTKDAHPSGAWSTPGQGTTLRGGFPPLRDLGNLLKALVLRMDFGERGRGQPPPSFFRV